jgi:hypothetical protein
MKIIKVTTTSASIPVSKIQELDKALKERFSPTFDPKIMIYCVINYNNSKNFMVSEFDVCCDDADVFTTLPHLIIGFIMGIPSFWEIPITMHTLM